jgi:hypothetical protein
MLPTAPGSFDRPAIMASAPAESAPAVDFRRAPDPGHHNVPAGAPLSPDGPSAVQVPDAARPSALEYMVHPGDLGGYNAALGRLGQIDRQAVIARIEMQNSYEEIAQALGQPDAAAARALVVAALSRLCEEMGQ